jgi:hypothetical protein
MTSNGLSVGMGCVCFGAFVDFNTARVGCLVSSSTVASVSITIGGDNAIDANLVGSARVVVTLVDVDAVWAVVVFLIADVAFAFVTKAIVDFGVSVDAVGIGRTWMLKIFVRRHVTLVDFHAHQSVFLDLLVWVTRPCVSVVARAPGAKAGSKFGTLRVYAFNFFAQEYSTHLISSSEIGDAFDKVGAAFTIAGPAGTTDTSEPGPIGICFWCQVGTRCFVVAVVSAGVAFVDITAGCTVAVVIGEAVSTGASVEMTVARTNAGRGLIVAYCAGVTVVGYAGSTFIDVHTSEGREVGWISCTGHVSGWTVADVGAGSVFAVKNKSGSKFTNILVGTFIDVNAVTIDVDVAGRARTGVSIIASDCLNLVGAVRVRATRRNLGGAFVNVVTVVCIGVENLTGEAFTNVTAFVVLACRSWATAICVVCAFVHIDAIAEVVSLEVVASRAEATVAQTIAAAAVDSVSADGTRWCSTCMLW